MWLDWIKEVKEFYDIERVKCWLWMFEGWLWGMNYLLDCEYKGVKCLLWNVLDREYVVYMSKVCVDIDKVVEVDLCFFWKFIKCIKLKIFRLYFEIIDFIGKKNIDLEGVVEVFVDYYEILYSCFMD